MSALRSLALVMAQAVVVGVVIAACAFDPSGLGDLRPDAGRAAAAAGGRGGSSAGGGAGPSGAGGGGSARADAGAAAADAADVADARIPIDSDAPCLIGLAGTACAPEGLRCTQEDPVACQVVQCSCVAAHFTCAVTPLPCHDR